ncbi:MAG: hypothetical protein P4L60_18585 [Clostridium sp.]|nr:hypothetical protein [Clostridium sp.]
MRNSYVVSRIYYSIQKISWKLEVTKDKRVINRNYIVKVANDVKFERAAMNTIVIVDNADIVIIML